MKRKNANIFKQTAVKPKFGVNHSNYCGVVRNNSDEADKDNFINRKDSRSSLLKQCKLDNDNKLPYGMSDNAKFKRLGIYSISDGHYSNDNSSYNNKNNKALETLYFDIYHKKIILNTDTQFESQSNQSLNPQSTAKHISSNFQDQRRKMSSSIKKEITSSVNNAYYNQKPTNVATDFYLAEENIDMNNDFVSTNKNNNKNYDGDMNNITIDDYFLYNVTDYVRDKFKIIEESSEKEKLFAKLSHEFKTPLNSIVGLINSLLEESPKEFKEKLSMINNLSNYVIFLISDIIQYVNLKNLNELKLQTTEINIREILGFCYQILNSLLSCNKNKRENISTNLLIDHEIDRFIIKGDEFRVKQVLLNLISNAVKFTNNGKIIIKCKKIYNNKDTHLKNYPLIKISVKDTGIGIKDSDRKFLFLDYKMLNIEENLKNNALGSGLGLSICKSLLNQMKMQIEVKSKYLQGSKFSIIIPSKEIINNFPLEIRKNIVNKLNEEYFHPKINYKNINQEENIFDMKGIFYYNLRRDFNHFDKNSVTKNKYNSSMDLKNILNQTKINYPNQKQNLSYNNNSNCYGEGRKSGSLNSIHNIASNNRISKFIKNKPFVIFPLNHPSLNLENSRDEKRKIDNEYILSSVSGSFIKDGEGLFFTVVYN